MTIFYEGNPLVGANLGKTTPYWLNTHLFKDILAIIQPIAENLLPEKRSGFGYEIHAVYQACVQVSQCSPESVGEWMNESCKTSDISFQHFSTKAFANGKKRRFD